MSDLHWIEELREKAEACAETWWTPDSWPINEIFIEAASPDRILQLLSLLHEVSTDADPAGTVRELAVAKETIKAQELLIQELRAEIERLRNG